MESADLPLSPATALSALAQDVAAVFDLQLVIPGLFPEVRLETFGEDRAARVRLPVDVPVRDLDADEDAEDDDDQVDADRRPFLLPGMRDDTAQNQAEPPARQR